MKQLWKFPFVYSGPYGRNNFFVEGKRICVCRIKSKYLHNFYIWSKSSTLECMDQYLDFCICWEGTCSLVYCLEVFESCSVSIPFWCLVNKTLAYKKKNKLVALTKTMWDKYIMEHIKYYWRYGKQTFRIFVWKIFFFLMEIIILVTMSINQSNFSSIIFCRVCCVLFMNVVSQVAFTHLD